jgi:starvation-inducible DNA-binding protein
MSKLLADTYTLYLKTHNYHWNVTGPMFTTLHLLFAKQYNELALAVDEIAERIRALGESAPGTYRQFVELSVIGENADRSGRTEMLSRLVTANETVVRTARTAFPVADEAGDQPTADLLSERLRRMPGRSAAFSSSRGAQDRRPRIGAGA